MNLKSKIPDDTDIYIVNAYGKTKSFYNYCKSVFLGGSIINHGGQNPLEAARFGCKILHGPNVSNFKEIYAFLNQNKISSKITSPKMMSKILVKFFSKKSVSNKVKKKINNIGQKILMLLTKRLIYYLKMKFKKPKFWDNQRNIILVNFAISIISYIFNN